MNDGCRGAVNDGGGGGAVNDGGGGALWDGGGAGASSDGIDESTVVGGGGANWLGGLISRGATTLPCGERCLGRSYSP